MIAEKRRATLALAAAKTFAELAGDYMTRAGPALATYTQHERQRHLDNDILPRLGALRIEEVTGAEVVALVERVGARSPTVARVCFGISDRALYLRNPGGQ